MVMRWNPNPLGAKVGTMAPGEVGRRNQLAKALREQRRDSDVFVPGPARRPAAAKESYLGVGALYAPLSKANRPLERPSEAKKPAPKPEPAPKPKGRRNEPVSRPHLSSKFTFKRPTKSDTPQSPFGTRTRTRGKSDAYDR